MESGIWKNHLRFGVYWIDKETKEKTNRYRKNRDVMGLHTIT